MQLAWSIRITSRKLSRPQPSGVCSPTYGPFSASRCRKLVWPFFSSVSFDRGLGFAQRSWQWPLGSLWCASSVLWSASSSAAQSLDSGTRTSIQRRIVGPAMCRSIIPLLLAVSSAVLFSPACLTSSAASSAFLDLVFAIYPGFVIWHLQMPMWKKFSTIGLMSLGLA